MTNNIFNNKTECERNALIRLVYEWSSYHEKNIVLIILYKYTLLL